MTNFVVRRVSQHTSNPIKNKSHQNLLIEPNKIIFESDECANRVGVVKITNFFKNIIEFEVKQPREQCLKVKFSKNILGCNQSVQIYVFYNPSTYIKGINDQFIISTNLNKVYSIAVPILVRNPEQIKRMIKAQRGQSKNKQNLKVIKFQHFNHHIGQTKRKAGFMCSGKDSESDPRHHNNLTGRVQKFEDQYSRILNFLKDKAIKSEVYLGEKPITKEQHYDIIAFNLNIEVMAKQVIKQKIIKRYKCQKSKNGPSVRILNNIKLKWSKSRNQPKITYKKGLQKLLRQVMKFVIYYRFKKMNKILSIYQNLRQQQNIQQPQTKIINKRGDFSVQQLNEEQSEVWNENEEDRQYQLQIQQKKKHQYYCRKINKIVGNKKERNLGAQFTQFTLIPRTLPMDYEDPESKKNLNFQIKSRIGFDNWVALEQSTAFNHELLGYQKLQRIFEWECHPSYQFNNSSLKQRKHGNQIQKKEGIAMKIKIQNYVKTLKHFQAGPSLEWLQKQYSQVNLNHLPIYKIYQTPNLSESFSGSQFSKGQTQALKPLKLNSHAIDQIKCLSQDYFSYYSAPMKPLVLDLIQSIHTLKLMYRVERNETIDFDKPQQLIKKKVQYLQRCQFKGLFETIQFSSMQNREQCIDNCPPDHNQQLSQSTQQRDETVYSKRMENIEKMKQKQVGMGQSRIGSYNQFIKNPNHLIYF